jgi:hypothetical protein
MRPLEETLADVWCNIVEAAQGSDVDLNPVPLRFNWNKIRRVLIDARPLTAHQRYQKWLDSRKRGADEMHEGSSTGRAKKGRK